MHTVAKEKTHSSVKAASEWLKDHTDDSISVWIPNFEIEDRLAMVFVPAYVNFCNVHSLWRWQPLKILTISKLFTSGLLICRSSLNFKQWPHETFTTKFAETDTNWGGSKTRFRRALDHFDASNILDHNLVSFQNVAKLLTIIRRWCKQGLSIYLESILITLSVPAKFYL